MTRARIYSQSGVGGGITSNVAANVTLATLSPFLTTSNVTELVNLYFTNARVFANLQLASINAFQDVNTANSANGQALLWDGSSNIWYPGNVISLSTITPFLTTANVAESNSNLYYTNARARTALSPADPTIIIDYSTGTIRANILAVSEASGTSDTIPEGFTNLYFTNARVKTALSLANLVDIGDVTYTGTPSNNQVLTWNSVGGYWTNTTGAAGASASFAETSNVANTVLTLSNFTTYDLAPDPNGVNPYFSNTRVLALFSPGGNTQITTSNIAEGSNLYYTNARVNAMITVAVTDSITPFLTTANVRETSNLYYTNARVLSYVRTLSTSNLAEGSNLYYTNTRVITAVLPYLTTSNVSESTSNLYFTNARVYANIAPLLTTANIIESVSNLYYTNARVNAYIQPWLTTANLLESANNLFYTNARVLANIAVSNIATKFLTVTGNIYATDNVTTSKNLILAKNASAASANGLGIYIDGANASILYNDNTGSLDVNKNLIISGNLLPSVSGNFNIGSADKRFISMFLGTETLFIGNISLGESPKGGLAIQTPNGLPSDASFANITATETVTLSRFSNVELGLEANGYFGGNVAQFINNKTGNIYYGIKKNDNWDSFAGMRVSETRIIAEPVYPTYTWNVVNSFSSDYVLSGYSSGNDIPLTVTAGDTLVFSVNAPSHPFWIKTSQITGTGSGVTTGTITGNGTDVGTVTWNTSGVVPGTYYYICQVHASMGGTITVLADTYPKGNVRSDLVFFNDNELKNNSVARLSILGDGNTSFYGNIYQDTGSKIYSNLVGNVTGFVSSIANHTTANLAESNSNLYYTNARVNSFVQPYLTTSNVSEVNNLYYTNARVRSTLSAGTGVTYDSGAGSISIGQDVGTNANVTFRRVTITDNLTIYGNVTTYNSNNISISDNMIYLNNGSSTSNPDIGFAFNYNDGVYHHGGFFRDASDGIFKVFDNYDPEPDTNIFINTNDASFRLANLQATAFYGNLIGTVSTLSNFTTNNLVEGLNLYYTNARINAFIQGNLAVKSNVTDLTTANVTELTNLYYTNARVNSFIQGNLASKANVTDLTTANVSELTNLYYTNARVLANVSQMSINVFADVDISGIQTNDSLLWNGSSFVAGTLALDQANTAQLANVANSVLSLNNFTTSNLAEGTNLYFTNARAVLGLVGQDVNLNNLIVAGNLTVQGDFTTLNVSTLSIEDKNITLGKGLTTAAEADGAGISIDGAQANITYLVVGDKFNINKNVRVLGDIQANTWTGLYTGNILESNNLFYTNTRVISAVTPYLTTANVLETSNYLYFTNTRAAIGLTNQDISVRDLYAAGNLTVQGDFTTLNVNTLNVEDKNITLGKGLTTSAQADGAGISIDGAQANITYLVVGDKFNINKNVEVLGDIKANTWTGLYSSNIIELTNLFYTNARVYSAIEGNLAAKANVSDLTTANVSELTNLYYTNARVYAAIQGNLATKANVADLTTSNVAEGSNLYYTNARVYSAIQGNLATKANVADLTTSNVAEGSNLYYTNARVLANVSQMSINVFADVDMTGLQTSGILIWNGSVFVAGTVNAATVSNTALVAYQADNANTAGFANIANVANIVVSIGNFTTSNLAEGSNLYYTNARVNSFIQGNLASKANVTDLTTANVTELTNLYYTNARVVSAVTPYLTTSNVIEGANLYFTNARAAIGLTGLNVSVNDLYAAGNLTVQGDFTTLNVATLDIEDKNITLGKGLTTSAQADGAGITVDGAQANITYLVIGDKFNINKNVEVLGDIKANTWTGLYTGNILESNNQFFTNTRAVLAITPYLTTANVSELTNQYFTNARVTANLELQSINVFADVDITGISNDELLLWNSSVNRFLPSSFSNKLTTANVVELTNLYFTNARVITALSTSTANISVFNLSTSGLLTVSSAIAGESVTGIEFSNNPAGGVGDTAKIQYYAANIGINDDTVLELSVANNIGDSINFKTAGGGVGVNVARPVAEFDVAGNINARNSLIFSSVVVGPTALFNTVTANTWNNLYTSNVVEGNNLYYTNSRVVSAVTPLLTTSNVIEGSNLYYTNARVYAAIQGNLATKANVTDLTTANVIELNNLYYTNARVLSIVTPLLTTANVLESSSNLYYTNARVNSFIQGNLATKANVTDLTTANVSELTNLYYTNARVFANVAQMSVNVFADVDITGVSTGFGLVWDGSKFVTLAPATSIATANIAIFASNANVANTVLSIANFTTANLTEGTNLYFTNARVISGLVGQDVSLNNLTVAGDLVVQGNTVTLNTATLIVEDKNILLANGATNSATADGAGFNIAGAQANLTYRSTGDKFELNKPLDVLGNVKVSTAINYANTTNVTKVYQYYNESTQSLDTIFL